MNRGVWLAVALMLFGLLVLAANGMAKTDDKAVPPALAPWQSWVLHGQDERVCPAHFNDPDHHVCWWPSQLILDVGDQGGLFDQQVIVHAPTWVTLPGDASHWPESVFGETQPLPVTGRDGRPCIWLPPGEHLIRGAFVWDALPEIFQIPEPTGILSLKINGREVDEPDLDAGGRLRFHGRGQDARVQDAMSASVFRLIIDDVPMQVVTCIRLDVSGRPRELPLSVRLPDGAVVMEIDSPLPARLATDGTLVVQASPGQWEIRLKERLTGPVSSLSAGSGPYGEEIWSFRAFNHLRMINITGAPSLEPSRTRMPDQWKGFPAYLMTPGSKLKFEVLRRGDPAPPPNQLKLKRTWWLDFEGSGFTIHDRIDGTVRRTWHMTMGSPTELGRATVDGQDQLITLQGGRPPGARDPAAPRPAFDDGRQPSAAHIGNPAGRGVGSRLSAGQRDP